MHKTLFRVLLCSVLLLFPVMKAEGKESAVYSSILSEYHNILDSQGAPAALEYLQAQHALHPECASLSFALGALKCEWDESYFVYTATEEACPYLEDAYAMDPDSPDSIWGQGLLAYKKQDYDQALSLMTDFISSISPFPDEGNLSTESSSGIISCLDQYTTAAFVTLECCARCDIADELSALDMLMTQTHSFLDPSRFNPKTVRRGMQILYYGVQYAEQTGNLELAYRYAQDVVCIHAIIERDLTFRGLTDVTINQDKALQYLNEMLAIEFYCLDILRSHYFQPTAS